jgi:hypothetical protein
MLRILITGAALKRWFTGLAVVVVLLGGVATIRLVHDTPAANQVADAGVLRAHYEGSVVTCDPSSATAWNDARQGTGGQVNVQGPAVVVVAVGVNGRTRKLWQQITKSDNMMTWDMPLYARADTIAISVQTANSYGTCQITTPEYPGITRSRALYGAVG